MKKDVVILITKQFFKKAFSTKGLFALLLLFLAILIYVTVNGFKAFEKQQHTALYYQEKSRDSWENNPDKHPHRMAHFGSFIFRLQHPLTIFDSGIESYTGNAIFLEAHKQNTANFSKASVSSGLVRFGDLNIAILLQLFLPLIIFFLGYNAIVYEKENGTLKIIYIQGATIKEIIFGKLLGLFLVSSLFFLPAFLSLWSIAILEDTTIHNHLITRCVFITISYFIFYFIICCITILISSISKNTNKALLSLLSIWLFFFIIFPKAAQATGYLTYPNLSQIAFKAIVKEKTAKKGNSHNLNDPIFLELRDSILKAHKVATVKELPFNYGGFLMRRGEKQSAIIYNQEHKKLINTYIKQNSITNYAVLLNPYLAIKNLSMSMSGTDFNTYTNFLLQAEKYRYKQSQYMNNLQMKFISNKAKSSEGKIHVVHKEHWKLLPKFSYQYIAIIESIKSQLLTITALVLWTALLLFMLIKRLEHFKII
ncbi:DUF3526 domain-containing protein [Tenacibaculum aestuariivivum]|uniref:DUF3526 domain-containing protein n=1 Tax=Tenacibaculum aestuariivivum TaxID=2006131 RepID=UPI003AB5C929